MKKILIAALAATTALTSLSSAGIAAAQPGWQGDRDHGRDHDHGRDRDRNHNGVPDRVEAWQRSDWDRDRDRWANGGYHRYGGHYGYNGYAGAWRTGQRYPHWRDHRYVVNDWRAYHLPPPRQGYRYYRDDNGDIVMAAVTSGVIGLIIGSAMSH
jgi:Ni/Co efflux regulator RcnB